MTASTKRNPSRRNRGRTVIALALLLSVLVMLFCGCSDSKDKEETGAAGTTTVEDSPETEDLGEIVSRNVYTVSDLAYDDPRLDAEVAVCGEQKLTNRQLQIYYSMQFFGFMNQYGMYAAYFGLDTSKPLYEQASIQDGMTWEQLFLASALEQHSQMAALTEEARLEGFTLSEEDQQELQKAIDELDKQAAENGYETVEAYIQESFGHTVKKEDYVAFMNSYFYVMAYEDKLSKEFTHSDEDLMAYFESHKQDNQEYQIISSTDQANVNVRHILIEPEDADGDQTVSDEEKQAALKKAEQLLETWKEDPTEDHFAELAGEHSTDPGSKSAGGLYEDVYPGQMVQAFNDWCFDASRQTGDTGIVETDYGFHIMYFVSVTDHYQWKILAERDYINDRLLTKVTEITQKRPTDVDYSAIVLSPIPIPEETDK